MPLHTLLEKHRHILNQEDEGTVHASLSDLNVWTCMGHVIILGKIYFFVTAVSQQLTMFDNSNWRRSYGYAYDEIVNADVNLILPISH